MIHRRDLRREDYGVTAVLKGPADNLLRVSVRVSGVDEVDACVERLVDDPDGVLRVAVADRSGEHERAEPVRADLDACSAKVPVLHEDAPDVSVTCADASVHVHCHQAESLSGTIRNSFPVSNRRGHGTRVRQDDGSVGGAQCRPVSASAL
jgi:hypothetical protein